MRCIRTLHVAFASTRLHDDIDRAELDRHRASRIYDGNLHRRDLDRFPVEESTRMRAVLKCAERLCVGRQTFAKEPPRGPIASA